VTPCQLLEGFPRGRFVPGHALLKSQGGQQSKGSAIVGHRWVRFGGGAQLS
jgi:hypothetical protein